MNLEIGLLNIVLSLLAGIVCGTIITALFKRPQPIIEFGLSAIIAALSPIILRDVWIVGIGKTDLAGINGSFLLLGTFATTCMIFLYRIVSRQKAVRQAG
jgi:hypothetical protein